MTFALGMFAAGFGAALLVVCVILAAAKPPAGACRLCAEAAHDPRCGGHLCAYCCRNACRCITRPQPQRSEPVRAVPEPRAASDELPIGKRLEVD